MADAVLDRRVALEEAFESAEADAKGEEYTPPIHEPAEPVVDREEPAPIDEDPALAEQRAAEKLALKEKPRTKGVPLSERGKPAPVAAKPDAGTQQDGTQPTGGEGAEKAPLGWGPARDALWAKVPADVRSAISKREREVQQGMSQAGRIRAVADEYLGVIKPFELVIQSMGTNPKNAITSVMQTATAMIVGTQAQKVAVLTEMCDRYGVDLGELDKSLSSMLANKGKGGPQPNQNAPMDPRLMQHLQPLFQMEQRLRESEVQRQHHLQQEAASAIGTIQGEQYFEDVRDDMADIMEISAKRGHIMTIKEAYTKACQIHPEISKLVPRSTNKTPADAVARARRAASTVRGAPGGAALSAKADRRSQLEAAWDSQ